MTANYYCNDVASAAPSPQTSHLESSTPYSLIPAPFMQQHRMEGKYCIVCNSPITQINATINIKRNFCKLFGIRADSSFLEEEHPFCTFCSLKSTKMWRLNEDIQLLQSQLDGIVNDMAVVIVNSFTPALYERPGYFIKRQIFHRWLEKVTRRRHSLPQACHAEDQNRLYSANMREHDRSFQPNDVTSPCSANSKNHYQSFLAQQKRLNELESDMSDNDSTSPQFSPSPSPINKCNKILENSSEPIELMESSNAVLITQCTTNEILCGNESIQIHQEINCNLTSLITPAILSSKSLKNSLKRHKKRRRKSSKRKSILTEEGNEKVRNWLHDLENISLQNSDHSVIQLVGKPSENVTSETLITDPEIQIETKPNDRNASCHKNKKVKMKEKQSNSESSIQEIEISVGNNQIITSSQPKDLNEADKVKIHSRLKNTLFPRKVPPKRRFSCTVCKRNFKVRQGLNMHFRVHTQ